MRKGINYDIGTLIQDKELTRELFDCSVVKQEMEIIKNDLHCDSIRITGQDISRLIAASEYALQQGLEVWLSPALNNASEKETLEYLKECAIAAQKLQNFSPGVLFVLGSEMTVNMRGFIEGDSPADRIKTLLTPLHLFKSTLLKGPYQKKFGEFLSKAVSVIRDYFYGRITYAAGSWENVDWSIFDFIGINYFREIINRNIFREDLKKYIACRKPVVVLELGCGTHKGAENRGSYGWAVLEREKKPSKVKEEFVHNEESQDDCLVNMLTVFKEENVNGVFAYTFQSPSHSYSYDPEVILDASLVKTVDKQQDETYKNMPWDKKSFYELAEFYARL